MVESTAKLALRGCEILHQETDTQVAEELKIGLYLSTLTFFKMSEADKEQLGGKKKTKKGTKAAGPVAS